MHIRHKFEYFDQLEGKRCVQAWRRMLLEQLPSHLHTSIKWMNEVKMKKIMDLMKIRIHFYKDMLNHTYFFAEPDYEGEISEKMVRKLK